MNPMVSRPVLTSLAAVQSAPFNALVPRPARYRTLNRFGRFTVLPFPPTYLTSGHAGSCGKEMQLKTHIDLQTLEPRLLFANAALAVAIDAGVLRISGTSDADSISVARANSAWKISNGTWTTSLRGGASSIFIKAGAGDDSVKIDSGILTPARVFGNSGNDTLIGGSGADSLYGHAGNDALFGSAGNDTLVSIGGGLRDSVTGGDGDDSYWIDAGTSERVTDPSPSENRNSAVHRVGAFQTLKGKAVSKEITGDRVDLPDPTSNHAGGKWNRFSSTPLFGASGPSIDDVEQGALGDCYVHAPLAAVAARNPTRIRETFADLGDGTFVVQLQRGTNKLFYRLDADLPVTRYSASTPEYAGFGSQKSLWAPLFEKAFAFHRTGAATYSSIGDGGWFDETYSALGMASSDRWSFEFNSGKNMLAQIEAELAAGNVVTIGTSAIVADSGSSLVGGHAYTVVRIVKNADGTKSAIIRNPWAVDGGNVPSGDANDGYLRVSAAQLKINSFAFSSAVV